MVKQISNQKMHKTSTLQNRNNWWTICLLQRRWWPIQTKDGIASRLSLFFSSIPSPYFRSSRTLPCHRTRLPWLWELRLAKPGL